MLIARFMATPFGRGIRIVVGIALIVLGIAIGGAGGWVLGIVGVVPLAAGVLNICVLAPFLGAPLRGDHARHA